MFLAHTRIDNPKPIPVKKPIQQLKTTPINYHRTLSKWVLVVLSSLFLLMIPGLSWSQISISDTSAITQNFDSLGTSATATLPAGWKMSAAGAGTSAGYSTSGNLTAVTQQASSGSSPTAGGALQLGLLIQRSRSWLYDFRILCQPQRHHGCFQEFDRKHHHRLQHLL